MKVEIVLRSPNVESPIYVYRACPCCGDKGLLRFDGEVLCTRCDWDSIGLHVEAMIDDHCRTFKKNRNAVSEQAPDLSDRRLVTKTTSRAIGLSQCVLREVKNG